MSAADFWNNQEKAQAVVQELKGLNTLLKPLEELIRADDEIRTLVEMGQEDESFIPELREHLAPHFAKFQLPDAFVFAEAIPRTSAGKFKKTELRERFREWSWTAADLRPEGPLC